MFIFYILKHTGNISHYVSRKNLRCCRVAGKNHMSLLSRRGRPWLTPGLARGQKGRCGLPGQFWIVTIFLSWRFYRFLWTKFFRAVQINRNFRFSKSASSLKKLKDKVDCKLLTTFSRSNVKIKISTPICLEIDFNGSSRVWFHKNLNVEIRNRVIRNRKVSTRRRVISWD